MSSAFQAYPDVLLALCVWREARGQSPSAQLGVLWVMRNRVNTRHMPIEGVILQPRQFSSFNSNDPNATKFPNPANEADWVGFRCICDLVADVTADPTRGATHYHSIPDGTIFPNWADERKLTCRIGSFRFYKLEEG